jgi:hypothetical protein
MSDRSRRRPALESLEGRLLLTGASSRTSTLLINSEPTIDTATPQQLGAAYHQVVAVQTRTLLALGNDYRRVQATATQLAAAANQAIARNRHIVQVSGEIASRFEQGLDIARGIEDQAANRDMIYIPAGLYPSGLGNLVKVAETLSQELSYYARRSTDGVIHKLHTLSEQLT